MLLFVNTGGRMKHSTTFRFNPKTLAVLENLSQTLHCSKTTIVEQAIEAYAQKKTQKISPLLKHAGVLSDAQAQEMLETIKQHKYNKDKDIEL